MLFIGNREEHVIGETLDAMTTTTEPVVIKFGGLGEATCLCWRHGTSQDHIRRRRVGEQSNLRQRSNQIAFHRTIWKLSAAIQARPFKRRNNLARSG